MNTIRITIKQTVSELLRDGFINDAGVAMINADGYDAWVSHAETHAIAAINRIGRDAGDAAQQVEP